ncbi:unnamed protein product [Paramecium sonneborni]|uniref:Uncharacterized protein n=1 Tax=Paramecium sonneborni TaxID=65129 RepID=A0A8S1NBN3_9CILI|nr:unnamed protein product [Paramecium sonneborni]
MAQIQPFSSNRIGRAFPIIQCIQDVYQKKIIYTDIEYIVLGKTKLQIQSELHCRCYFGEYGLKIKIQIHLFLFMKYRLSLQQNATG